MKNITKFAVSFVAVAALFIAANVQAYTHSVTLKMGSTGSQVMELQKALNAKGFAVSATGAGSAGMESTYFGAKTKAAVMAFQAGNMLTADGVVGPMSGAKLGGAVSGNFPAGCTSASGFSPITGVACDPISNPNTPTGPLAGTDGAINDVNELSQYSAEEVGEGESDVKILGFEVETTNDGDIAIKSAKLSFTITNASGSDNLDDYIDSASVWMGSTKVGSADVEDFSEGDSGIWTKTVTLSSPVVKSDDSEEFYVTVDAVNTFDSGDIDSEVFTADVDNVRFTDGSGVVTTEDMADLGDMDVSVAFVSYSASADTELKLSAHSDNPEAGIVVASNSGTTDDVTLLKGEIEIEGESDVVIDEFPVTFGATTSNFNTMISSIKLIIDGEEYSESVPSIAAGATASIIFNNLDFTIDAGETIDFEVVAEVADTDDFTAGATVTASVTATNRLAIDAENEQGDSLTAGERSGTVGGEAQEFRANGITVDLISTDEVKSASDTNNGDTATFTIKFKITAVGDDMYVATTASTAGAMNNLYSVDYSGTATLTDVSAVLTNNTDTDVTSGLYLIEEGESETFTLTVLRSPSDTDDLFRASLTSIKWDDEAGDTTPDNNYTTNLDDFKTDYVALD